MIAKLVAFSVLWIAGAHLLLPATLVGIGAFMLAIATWSAFVGVLQDRRDREPPRMIALSPRSRALGGRS